MRIVQLDKIFSILDQHDHAFFLGDYNFPDGTPEDKHIGRNFKDIWKEAVGDIILGPHFCITFSNYLFIHFIPFNSFLLTSMFEHALCFNKLNYLIISH